MMSFQFPDQTDITKNLEEIKVALGRFQTKIWKGISVIERKKLFTIPFLRDVHGISIYPYDIEIGNFDGPFEILKNVNNLHIAAKILINPMPRTQKRLRFSQSLITSLRSFAFQAILLMI
eukprot:NODE_354_length_10253_cov_0.271519.p9 type:complete len:120 gc:universal NODE_354_length_10253_cov_0.271519:5311-4952(-)